MTLTPPAPRQVASWRLVFTLSVAGALSGLLLVFVYHGTQPTIRAHKAERLRKAIEEVLGAPDRYETLYVVNGALAPAPPAGGDPEELERVYVGYAANADPVGVAIVGAAPGYQDVVKVMFGYDPSSRALLGMKVLESKETPGLGDKIEKDAEFVDQFAGSQPPLVGVKKGRSGDDPQKIDMITGATISSRAVIRIIDDTLARLGPLLDAAELAP
jgi:electron transport complex protein RnfG